MCGIAGAVIDAPSGAAESAVRAMLPALARRGPDAEGVQNWPSVCFGHRRLAILDLSPAGAQPMSSRDGSCTIVFNGCIYNFQEIRRELEQRGRVFRSNCDTEILVEGYREWGVDSLAPRLRGMFAFAVWDSALGSLTLVRDRLGVKPLVYREWAGNIAFASTVGALREAGLAGEMDADSALEFLDLGFVTDTRCIYQGIRKLPPATILEWRGGRCSERTYWDLPEVFDRSDIGFDEAVDQTEKLVVESVRLRLISDVPVGALLSGGIDSTLVCWALSKLDAKVEAFTVGTPGEADDESADAQDIAARLGVSHQIVNIDTAEPPPLEDLAAAYSEPFASSSALGMLRVSRAIRGKATVLLTGDGGDDVFLGYPFFRNAWSAEKLARRLPDASRHLWPAVRPLTKVHPRLRSARSFLDYTMGGIGAYGRVRRGVPWFEEHGVLGARLRGRKVAYREVPPSGESSRRLLSDVFQFHRRMHFTSEFMPKVDGGTMQYSLEARAPFLDQKLWEFAAALPPELHFRNGRLKAILREIVRRHVGTEVAFRRKQGFTIPVERWLVTKWRREIEDLKGDTVLARDGWIDREALSRAVDECLSRGAAPVQMWHTLVFENWLRRQQIHEPAVSMAQAAIQS